MSILKKLKHIGRELRSHAPFTVFGALAGLAFMLIFRNASKSQVHILFSIFHPGHVVLSAMVTASMFALHKKKRNFLVILVVGYLGAIGIVTLSDSIIPYFGESILGVNVPVHSKMHQKGHEHEMEHEDRLHDEEIHTHEHGHDEHKGGLHLGFIEEWYIVNPAALLGILIAYFAPHTKFPHAGHVLISTWASSSHVLMNLHKDISILILIGIFAVLFIAVWIPCCISDIVFPLLLSKPDEEIHH